MAKTLRRIGFRCPRCCPVGAFEAITAGVGLVFVLALVPCTSGESPGAPTGHTSLSSPFSSPASRVSQVERFAGQAAVRVAVLPGESLDELAERLYGDDRFAPLLARAGWPDTPEAAESVEVPLARVVPLPRGSSLSRLAALRCGDARRWPILAALSGIENADAIPPGTTIVLPARLVIRVSRGDSLARLAAWAWGEGQGAPLLARWNGLDPRRPLAIGQWLEVPLTGPRLGEDEGLSDASGSRSPRTSAGATDRADRRGW